MMIIIHLLIIIARFNSVSPKIVAIIALIVFIMNIIKNIKMGKLNILMLLLYANNVNLRNFV